MRRVRYLPAAVEDMFQMWLYWAERGESVHAAAYLAKLDETARKSLLRFPHSGRRRPELGAEIRSLQIVPYIVFYRVSPEQIEIVRVLHGRRDLKGPILSLFAEPRLAG